MTFPVISPHHPLHHSVAENATNSVVRFLDGNDIKSANKYVVDFLNGYKAQELDPMFFDIAAEFFADLFRATEKDVEKVIDKWPTS